MRRRPAFTLIEVMVSLVVTGVVAAMAYAAAQAGFDTDARLQRHREAAGGATVIRALIADALRHQVEGIRGGGEIFRLTDRAAADGTPADSLQLTTRGLASPLGAGAPWLVTLWRRGDTLHLQARPLDDVAGAGRSSPIVAEMGGVRGVDVQLLGRGLAAAWRPDWPEGDVAPDAVALTVAHADRPATRLVVRRGLERAP